MLDSGWSLFRDTRLAIYHIEREFGLNTDVSRSFMQAVLNLYYCRRFTTGAKGGEIKTIFVYSILDLYGVYGDYGGLHIVYFPVPEISDKDIIHLHRRDHSIVPRTHMIIRYINRDFMRDLGRLGIPKKEMISCRNYDDDDDVLIGTQRTLEYLETAKNDPDPSDIYLQAGKSLTTNVYLLLENTTKKDVIWIGHRRNDSFL